MMIEEELFMILEEMYLLIFRRYLFFYLFIIICHTSAGFFLFFLCICRQNLIFRVTCSKGTYIRSLCADFGKALGRQSSLLLLMLVASTLNLIPLILGCTILMNVPFSIPLMVIAVHQPTFGHSTSVQGPFVPFQSGDLLFAWFFNKA